MTLSQSKTKAAPPPRGIFVPVPTFFHHPASTTNSAKSPLQSTVDIPAQISHSIALAKAGIAGLVLLGSTGEAVHLSRTERKDLISGVRKGFTDGGFPEYPIVAGVLTNSVEDVLEGLKDAKEAGAQWGLVLAPGFFGSWGVGQEGLKGWYELIADRSPIPIMLYNFPGVTNNVMLSLDTYTSLAAHPNIVGCKMSHGNVSHHLQVSLSPNIDHDQFHVYTGLGQQLGPVVMFGAAGVIDGLAAFYPKTVVRLFKMLNSQLIAEKEVQEMRMLQFAVSSAEEMIGKWGIVGIKEGIHREMGIGHLDAGRLPMTARMPEREWEKWNGALGPMKTLEDRL